MNVLSYFIRRIYLYGNFIFEFQGGNLMYEFRRSVFFSYFECDIVTFTYLGLVIVNSWQTYENSIQSRFDAWILPHIWCVYVGRINSFYMMYLCIWKFDVWISKRNLMFEFQRGNLMFKFWRSVFSSCFFLFVCRNTCAIVIDVEFVWIALCKSCSSVISTLNQQIVLLCHYQRGRILQLKICTYYYLRFFKCNVLTFTYSSLVL